MLSYSNVSVDGAITEVAKHCTDRQVGEIVRYGYPKDKSLLDSDNLLTSYNVALNKNYELKFRQDRLVKEKEKINKATKEYKNIQEELKHIKAKIKSDENDIIHNAMFVATTLSKAVCDKQIMNQKFDAVIIDEVSMAYTPQVIYAANLAKEHFCCIGDFNQLPPIVQDENDKNILKYDIFEYCGDAGNMVVLDTQRRMHKDIANFISENMYFGLLKSHHSVEQRESISSCEPFFNSPIAYVDIHDIKPKTKKVNGGSHINLISALITARIAEKALENNDFSVGIITPYSEQAKLLNCVLNILLSDENKKRAVCATVHQFQGSQRDIIIYDATDAPGEITYPGTPLVSNKHNYSNRLFNVAMTRARGKFIVVADREFINSGLTKGRIERTKNSESLFHRLSRIAEAKNSLYTTYDLYFIDDYKSNKNISCFWVNEGIYNAYKHDLLCAKKHVQFNISSNITQDELYKTYQKEVNALERHNIYPDVYVDSYSNMKERYSSYIEKRNYVLYDLTIIDDEIIWVGNLYKEDTLCWRIKSKTIASKFKNTSYYD